MQYGIVTGHFESPKPLAPVTGTVYFTASSAALSASEKAIVLPAPVAVPVVAGAFAQGLRATTDPALNPTGFTYLVSFDLQADGRPIKFDSFSMILPADTTVDLSRVAPVPSSDGVRILRGEKGEKGDTGPQGPAGPPGEGGGSGELVPGPVGPAGPVGATGAQGPIGPIGPEGPQGATGLTGPRGEKGDTGTQGIQGLKGDTGAVGAQGVAGPKGDQGIPGTAGAKGDTGAAGPKGDTGAAGAKGDTGLTGAKGDTGAQGIQGVQGPKGDTGATGATGPTGPAGASAPIVHTPFTVRYVAGAWEFTTLAAAQAAGLNTSQVVWAIGNPTGSAPTWLRTGDVWTKGI